MPVNPGFWRPRQEDHDFKASLALNKIYLSSLQKLRSVKGRQNTVLLTKSSWINRKHKKSDWWYWTQGILDLNNKRSYVCGGGDTQAKDLPERKKDDDQAYRQEKQILLGCMRDAGSDSSPYSWCTGPKTYGSFQEILNRVISSSLWICFDV